MLANAKLETWPGRSREAPEARDVTKVGTPPPAPAPVLLRKNTASRAGAADGSVQRRFQTQLPIFQCRARRMVRGL
ncbi:MAG: hypothetical protein ACRETW_12275, partial [Stenotrophobium sp.]